MTHRHATRLFDSPLVRVVDVACRAPRSGRAEEEWASAAQIVLPRRGVFVVHRAGAAVVTDVTTALVLGAGEGYRVSHPVAGGDDCTVLVFPPALLVEALGGTAGRHGTLGAVPQFAVHGLTGALAAGAADRLEAEEAALRLLHTLASDLISPGPSGGRRPGPSQQRRVEEVRTLLASRPSERWSLDELARAVACSPFHLARQFRALTGESIARYLLRLRLGLALARLAQGEADLARLAVDLGFAHHSHFSARFRAVFGTTPTAARTALTRGRLSELSTILTADPGRDRLG